MKSESLSSLSAWRKLAGYATVTSLSLGAIFAVVACSSDDDDSGGGNTSTTNTSQVTCTPDAGNLPPATCDNSTSCGAAGSCAMTGSNCGSSSACLALATNSGTTDNFRLRGLYIVEPQALTTNAVQGAIVNTGLELTAPTCGESGTAFFNWLMTFDTSAMTMKTGGAPVPADPSGQSGFCYENAMEDGYQVSPQTAAIHQDSDGSYHTDTIASLNIPFGTSEGDVILPVTNIRFSGITLSENGNCIGSFNKSGVDNTCADVAGCNRWKTAGSLGGYITLEDADKVEVVQLQESLCALLGGYQTGTKDNDTGKCTRDASNAIVAKGDYCSTTQSAGGCQDSFWISGTFAASAVKVTDGSENIKCSGGTTTEDAGTTTTDAGTGTGDSGTTATDAGDGG